MAKMGKESGKEVEHGGEKSGNGEGKGKKISVAFKTIPCFSVCSIFLVNAARFVNVAEERRRLGRWRRGTVAQALVLYTPHQKMIRLMMVCNLVSGQQTLNYFKCLMEVNGNSFSH